MIARSLCLFLLLTFYPLTHTKAECYTVSSDAFQHYVKVIDSDLFKDEVAKVIADVLDVAGLDAAEVDRLRPSLSLYWKTLQVKKVLVVTGADADIRPSFVALQAIVEHVLSSELNKTIFDLKGVIHTPMPATPLCTEGDNLSEIVDASVAADPLRLLTVRARTRTIRDFLDKGGELHIAYPRGGLEKRTERQREVYARELAKYPDHLFDVPLECEEIAPELVGATYTFTNRNGERYVFAINITQANSTTETGTFGLWYGPERYPAIAKRVRAVTNLILDNR